MKKILVVIISFSFVSCVLGQNLFRVPEPTTEQKHDRMIYMFWANIVPGISFAKTKNFTPYEYGTYIGKQFAPYWDKDAGFKAYAQGILSSWAYFLREKDSSIVIEEESEKLLIFKVPAGVITDYFGENGLIGVSVEEMVETMNGSHEQISSYLNCTSKMELQEKWITVTVHNSIE